ncbi:MAG: phosphoribosylaminoimidazolesuccinocarboxamide synthase [Pseudomonadota bacterium]|nr:phosphoribosylaminoimidazolesuccinocarboxamide synthase [Pseudomonadota bacterium]
MSNFLQIPELVLSHQGKVRDIYEIKNQKNLLIYTSDRISAFDFVFDDTIPGKGALLNKLSLFWFDKTKNIIKNHIVGFQEINISSLSNEDKERCMLVRKVKVLPIEAIVRGYLAGSAWESYKKTKTINNKKTDIVYKEFDQFKEPIFTPSTKAEKGQRDQNISFEEMKNLIGEKLSEKIMDISIKLYTYAHSFAQKKGIIIADTKFEFGQDENGELILIDELFTPDCSRFWLYDIKTKEINFESFDKQFLRNYLININWQNQQISLPSDIKQELMLRYKSAYNLITN